MEQQTIRVEGADGTEGIEVMMDDEGKPVMRAVAHEDGTPVLRPRPHPAAGTADYVLDKLINASFRRDARTGKSRTE
eukprot:6108568-Prymnesium_polylepis.1